jgi:hypothetical protein
MIATSSLNGTFAVFGALATPAASLLPTWLALIVASLVVQKNLLQFFSTS